MLQSSTEAKWSPNNSLIMKISEMDRLKQTETSSEKKNAMQLKIESTCHLFFFNIGRAIDL